MSDRTPSLLSGPSNPVVPTLLLLAFSGISYLTLTGRLESRRPKSAEEAAPPTPVGAPGFETTFARLWQDPLASVYTADASQTTEATAKPCTRCIACVLGLDCAGESSETRLKQIQSQIHARVEDGLKDGKKVLCMPVLVPGGPYVETREQRRRTRYALLSALGDSGFSLLYPERMSYIKLPCIVAQTGPQGRADEVNNLIIPIKIHQRKAAVNDDPNEYSTVFVLWINESRLGLRPLHATGQILEQLFADVEKERKNAVDVAVLGPSSSDVLLKMAHDHGRWTQSTLENEDNCESGALSALNTTSYFSREFGEATLYSPRATIYMPLKNIQSERLNNTCPADQVLSADDAAALQHFLNRANTQDNSGLNVVRTIGDDRQLVELLKHELKLRHSWPRDRKTNPVHTVLITERDTLYGQAFRKEFDKSIAGNGYVHHFTFLRGIDGQYPHSDKYEDRPKKLYESGADTDGSGAPAISEFPHGASQFDYLRRLGDEIATLRHRLRSERQADIKSIGLIGTDVFDKLLILRALRPRFPAVKFFTTDLDARLAHPEELPYTRNLLVASHFGFAVDRETFCRTTLPFRDNYQTATYFSVRSAVDPSIRRDSALNLNDPWGLGTEQPSPSLRPLMFEVGRQGPYQLTSQKFGIKNHLSSRFVHPRSPGDDMSWLTWRWAMFAAAWMMAVSATVAYCASLQRGAVRSRYYRKALHAGLVVLLTLLALPAVFIFFTDNLRVLNTFLLGASLGTLVAASILSSRRLAANIRKAARGAATAGRRNRSHAFSLAVLLIVATAFLSLLAIAAFDHASHNGQAIEITSGLSVWPPTFIRFFALVLSVYCIFRIWRKLSRNCDEIRKRYATEVAPRQAGIPADRREPAATVQRYVNDLSFRLLFTRAVVWGAAFLLLIVVVCRFTEYPAISYRGQVAYWTAQAVLWSAALCVLAVVIVVLDAMFRAQRLIHELGRNHCDWQSVDCSEYKSEVAERFWQPARPRQGPAPPPYDSLNELLTVRLIAEHTRIVGPFVYLPFILLTIMLFARHGLVDHSYLPPAIIVVIAFFMALLVIAGYLLRRKANVAKAIALSRLQQQLSAAQATPNRRRLAEQINIIIADVNAERRGAFKPISDDPLLGALAVPSVVVALLLLAERYTVP